MDPRHRYSPRRRASLEGIDSEQGIAWRAALSPPSSRESEKTAIVTPTAAGREVVVYIRLQCEPGGSGFEPPRHKEHKETQSGFLVFLCGLWVFVVNGSES